MDFEKIYTEQAKLNERCGVPVLNIIDGLSVPVATIATHFAALMRLAGTHLNDYIMAVSNELEELRNCTNWKHWCKEAQQGNRFALNDLQNARVEVIDLFFFWMSLAQCVGLTPNMIEDLYYQKLDINHTRQDRGRTMNDEKTEEENRTVVSKEENL